MPEAIIAIAKKPKGSYPSFTIPEELDLSDLRDGETKEVLAVVRKEPGSKGCIVSLDGVTLGSDEPKDDRPYPERMMYKAKNAGLM
jgi:hypothetical protein